MRTDSESHKKIVLNAARDRRTSACDAFRVFLVIVILFL